MNVLDLTATGNYEYAAIVIPASVPSGYARQAAREATLANGFKSFKNGLIR